MGGIMLAMVESVDHVTETAKLLPTVPIVALVETARGLERITEIAAAKGTFRLAFGIGDFRRDTGFGRARPPWPCARSRFTIAAKAASLPGAIDGPTVGSRSALRLSEATAVSAEFGMTGKICLTPDQCPTVNEGLSPSQEEISWAREFFAGLSATAAKSAMVRTFRVSRGRAKFSNWRVPTVSRFPSSMTRLYTSRRRRTPTTTDRSLPTPATDGVRSPVGGDQIGGLLADDDAGCVGVPAHDARHHRGVGDSKAIDATDPQFGVDHAGLVAAHSAGSDRVVEGVRAWNCPIARSRVSSSSRVACSGRTSGR